MKKGEVKLLKVTKYDNFEDMKSSSEAKKSLSDEEALEKALELLDFFNSLKNAKPLN